MDRAGRGPDRGDPYRVLGVDTGASQRDIARAYRRAVQRAHPDTRPGDPAAGAARFQVLTEAYDLLRDPCRRAEYDRDHPASEPSGHPAGEPSGAPRRPGPVPGSQWPGSPFLLRPPPSQPIWAGPVHIEAPATASSQHADSSAAARFDDPVVILGLSPGRLWGWPW